MLLDMTAMAFLVPRLHGAPGCTAPAACPRR